MTFDWQRTLRETAEYLVAMSKRPGREDHAKHRRDELLADQTWAGLREAIQRVRLEGKADGRDRAGAPAADRDPAG